MNDLGWMKDLIIKGAKGWRGGETILPNVEFFYLD